MPQKLTDILRDVVDQGALNRCRAAIPQTHHPLECSRCRVPKYLKRYGVQGEMPEERTGETNVGECGIVAQQERSSLENALERCKEHRNIRLNAHNSIAIDTIADGIPLALSPQRRSRVRFKR